MPDAEALLAEQESLGEHIAKYFRYSHIKHDAARELSKHFAELALHVLNTAPRVPERTVALRKLLEGKDAAVRAALP